MKDIYYFIRFDVKLDSFICEFIKKLNKIGLTHYYL